MAITGNRYPTDNNPFDDILLVPYAERMGVLQGLSSGVPSTLGYLKVTTSIGVTYRLYPNCRNHRSDPTVTFYMAYSVNSGRVEYAVGPNKLDAFDESATMYAIAAGNFFGFTGNVQNYELSTSMAGYKVMQGDFKGAFQMLGQSWKEALQNPHWWMTTAMAFGGAVLAGEGAGARGVKPPVKGANLKNLEPPPPPVKNVNTLPENAPPPIAAGRPTPTSPALGRLNNSATNLQNTTVNRTAIVADRHMRFRHTITSDMPEVSVLRIQKEGQMRMSTGYKAHYGDGVYAWESNATGVGKYIDIEVPPGTAIEKLVVQGSGGQQVYYRIVGAEGDSVAVKVVGTNFTEAELAKFRFILED